MKSFYVILLFVVCYNSLAKVSLDEAYRRALTRGPMNKAIGKLEQAKYLSRKTKGSVLPQLSLRADLSRLDTSGVTSTSFVKSPRMVALELTQPLFSGMREYAELNKGQNNILLADIGIETTKSILLYDVAKAYIELLFYQDELKLKEEIIKLSSDRVKLLSARVKMGRSRESELLSAKALEATSVSELSEIKTALESGRENFSFLTGVDNKPEVAELTISIVLKPLSFYLNNISGIHYLRSEKLKINNSAEDIRVAKSGHYPKIDLKSDYYLDKNSANSESGWAVTLSATMPIFESGKTSADVAQAVQADLITKSDYLYKQQELEKEVKTIYESLILTEKQLESYQNSVELNRSNYQLQLKEYGYSLVTNLDVLQALVQYTQSRSRLNRLVANRYQDYYRLISLFGGEV